MPAKGSKIAIDLRNVPPFAPFILILTAVFGSMLSLLFGLSRLFLPSWEFVASVFLTPLTMPDLTPNPGLWWYFFIEMFDAFREFFLGVFWLHMLSYSVPFTLRFRKQPLAAVILMMGVIAVFQPYANVGDTGVWLSALCLLGHVFERESPAQSLTEYQAVHNG
jgi:phosphatidylinositol glycan class U